MATRTIRTLEEMDIYVDGVLATLPQKEGAHVIALSGDLGAGKTTFTQILAKKIGVTEHVTSPTFVIMRTYEADHDLFDTLVHIDAYRIEDIQEMEVLRIPEIFSRTGTIVCIEWPERVKEIIPEDAYNILISAHDDGSRIIMSQ